MSRHQSYISTTQFISTAGKEAHRFVLIARSGHCERSAHRDWHVWSRLPEVPATKVGEICIRAALERADLVPMQVDEVIMVNVLQAGLGQNPARQAAINAGLPVEIPALTINKVCGSGLKAVILAAQAIKLGDADIVVAGGMESMS